MVVSTHIGGVEMGVFKARAQVECPGYGDARGVWTGTAMAAASISDGI